jgi:hypothetical protein
VGTPPDGCDHPRFSVCLTKPCAATSTFSAAIRAACSSACGTVAGGTTAPRRPATTSPDPQALEQASRPPAVPDEAL